MASDDWDESRIDVIGQNGNDGLHYKRTNKMSDIIDDANHHVELNEQRSIKYAQYQAKTLEVLPQGLCLFCGEKFKEGSLLRWCDSFCRNSWEREKLMKR